MNYRDGDAKSGEFYLKGMVHMTDLISSPAKVAVVTGGGSGIGRATCLRLAKDSVAVAVWDLDSQGAEETAVLVTKVGGKAIARTVDVSSAKGIAVALDCTQRELGMVTILINNAATHARLPFPDITEEQWRRMLNINLLGPALCIKAVLPGMLEAGWGRIINISSSAAQTGGSLQAHYAASKAGVIGLTRALAMEYAAAGITVNAIPPGYVDTPMARDGAGGAFDAHAAASPMKRAGRPEEIAATCAFLASEEAGYITGQTISVNGGRYLA